MRPRISIRVYVRTSVGWSVRWGGEGKGGAGEGEEEEEVDASLFVPNLFSANMALSQVILQEASILMDASMESRVHATL